MITYLSSFIRKTWTWFANMSMQKKLVIIFIFLISLPITFVSLSSYHANSALILDTTSSSAGLMTDNAMDKIDRYILDLRRYTILPLYNKEVQKYMDQQGTDWDKNVTMNMFLTYLVNMKEEITAVYMIDRFDVVYYMNKPNINEIYPEERRKTWGRLTKESGVSPVLIGTHPIRINHNEQKYVFTMMRSIQSVSTLKDIGMIVIDVDVRLFEEIVQPLNSVTHGDTYIVDELGNVVYHSNQRLLGTNLKNSPLLTEARDHRGSFKAELDGKPYLVVYTTSIETGWKAITCIPLTELLAPMKQNRNTLIITTLIIISFALLVAIFISYALTMPLKRTVRLMKQVQRGNLDVQVQVKYNDEIGRLGSHFNRMVDRIRELLQEVYETEKSKQQADMLALQNQINPHFIYNTLESIRMQAELNDDDRVAELTYLLGLLLRYSITRSGEIVTVRQELDHVMNYLHLLQIRFPGKIEYEIDVPQNLFSLSIIKLVFQPIVENAVFHGLEKQDKLGKITITGRIEGKNVIFTISDNGIGMDQQRLAQLNNCLTDGQIDKFGIGLRNVNERIRLHYGEMSRITVDSRLGEGTTVTLKIYGLVEQA